MNAVQSIRHAAYHQNFDYVCDSCLRAVNYRGFCEYCQRTIPEVVCPDCGVVRNRPKKGVTG